MQEIGHVLDVLQRAKRAAKEGNISELKGLSDQTIHTASIENDEDNLIVAIILYALSKLIERKEYYPGKDYDDFLNYYLKTIDQLIETTKRKDFHAFDNYIKEMMKKTDKLSIEIRKSVQDLFRKARINKASKVYEHGLSMGRTASMLGVSEWELAEYIGQKSMGEGNLSRAIDVKQRIKNVMEFFNG
ncbi:MAG: hypothetical protein WC781_00930 [Candidatus Pacearchaeota archaeon]|jgi:DNA-directed RNA polymerase beta subunit